MHPFVPKDSYIKGFAYLVAWVNTVHLIDVLIIMWGTKAKGKIVDRKGNIQSGKKEILLGSTIVIIANPKA